MHKVRSSRASSPLTRILAVIGLFLGGLASGLGLASMAVGYGLVETREQEPDEASGPDGASQSFRASDLPAGTVELPDLQAYPEGVRIILEKRFGDARSVRTVFGTEVNKSLSSEIAIRLASNSDEIAPSLVGAIAALRKRRLLEAEIVITAIGRPEVSGATALLLALGDDVDAAVRILAIRSLCQAHESRPGASRGGLVIRGLVELGSPIGESTVLSAMIDWHGKSLPHETDVRIEALWAISGNLDDGRVVACVKASLEQSTFPAERDVARMLCYRAGPSSLSTAHEFTAALRESLARTNEVGALLRLEIRDAILHGDPAPPSLTRIIESGTTDESLSLLRALQFSVGTQPSSHTPWVREATERLADSPSSKVRGATAPIFSFLWLESRFGDDSVRRRLALILEDSGIDEMDRRHAAGRLASSALGGKAPLEQRRFLSDLLAGDRLPDTSRDALFETLRKMPTNDAEFEKWRDSLSTEEER